MLRALGADRPWLVRALLWHAVSWIVVPALIGVPVGLVAGALQGATGLSGPVLATYLHAFRLRPPAYVLSISLLFGVFGAVQAVGLIALGRLTGRLALEGLAATAVAMAVLPVGVRLGTRLSRRGFDRVVLAVLVLSSVKLLVDALA